MEIGMSKGGDGGMEGGERRRERVAALEVSIDPPDSNTPTLLLHSLPS